MKRKMVSEIWCDFKYLAILLLFSIFAIVKFSKEPVWFDFLLPVLACPPENSIQYGVWRILENLGLAYIAALIFYVLVTYIPKVKCEMRAYELARKRIEYIYSIMNDILAYFQYACAVENFQKVENEKIETINNFSFPMDIEYLSKTSFINGKKQEQEASVNQINGMRKIIGDGRQLEKTIDVLLLILESNQANPNLISLINRIRYSALLSTILETMPQSSPVVIGETVYIGAYLNFYNQLKEFADMVQELSEYDFSQISYKYQVASEEEKEKWDKEQEEARKRCPQIDELLTALEGNKRGSN